MTRDFCKSKAFYDLNLNYEQSYELGFLHGAAAERDRCCRIIFECCDSDNAAQRTVDKIRGEK